MNSVGGRESRSGAAREVDRHDRCFAQAKKSTDMVTPRPVGDAQRSRVQTAHFPGWKEAQAAAEAPPFEEPISREPRRGTCCRDVLKRFWSGTAEGT